MNSITSFAFLSLAAIGSLAAPTKRSPWDAHGCLTYGDAVLVAQKYGELIAAYTNETADAMLTSGFTDYSESVNTLINSCPQGDAAQPLPLLAATFNNLEEFKIGQGQQPAINFEQLQLWTSCSAVTIRWKTTNTAPGDNVKPVVGLIVMETVKAPAGNIYPYQIDRVYSEFDAGVWLQNLQAAGICSEKSGSTPLPDPEASSPAPPASTTAPSASKTASSSTTTTTATTRSTPRPAPLADADAQPTPTQTPSDDDEEPDDDEPAPAIVPTGGSSIIEAGTISALERRARLLI